MREALDGRDREFLFPGRRRHRARLGLTDFHAAAQWSIFAAQAPWKKRVHRAGSVTPSYGRRYANSTASSVKGSAANTEGSCYLAAVPEATTTPRATRTSR